MTLTSGLGSQIIHVIPIWRSGNQLYQAIHAIAYAQAFRHRVMTQAIPPLLPALDFDFSNGLASHERNLNTFYLKTSEMNGFDMTLDEKAFVARHFLAPSLLISPLLEDDSTLVIHLRSGDIMCAKTAHPRYTPLPFCFYEMVLQEQGFKNVVVVTEPDRSHPCLPLLVKEYGARVVVDLAEGFARLLGAKHLCACVSTFSGSAALCSLQLSTLYCAEELIPFRLTVRHKKPKFCELYLYRIEGLEKITWKATSEQKQMLARLGKGACARVDW